MYAPVIPQTNGATGMAGTSLSAKVSTLTGATKMDKPVSRVQYVAMLSLTIPGYL